MGVIDIKKRLLQKVKNDFEAGYPEDIQRNLEEMRKITEEKDTIEGLRELIDQVIEQVSSGMSELRFASQLADENDEKSVANLYVNIVIQAGGLFACSEALRMVAEQMSDLNPEMVDEHFLLMIEKIRSL